MKAKRSFLNLTIGIASQLVTIAFGIFIPRLLLVHYGSEVNGLLSSITQIMVYMTLLEAGVGAASLQALYKPFQRDDKQSINAILAATSMYYKKTGIYYFFAIIVIAFAYPLIIDSEIDSLTISIVILLTGFAGALNYYFQGKYRIFLTAEGKSYINTTIVTLINTVINIAKIALILLGFDIIALQTAHFVLTIIQIIIYEVYMKRNYKWLRFNIKPDLEAISQKNSVLVHQFSTLVFNNTDVLILTLFTNLKVVSVYVLYNMLFSIIDNVISTVNGSVTFVLGQTFHESKKKFLKLYDAYETYFMAFVFSLFTVAYILILPFMTLYTAGITDINYIDFWLPVLFISLKLLINARASSNNVINIAGHFKKTQYRSIIETTINIVCSLLFVYFFGIYGVLLGTIVALLYRAIDIILYANKHILKRSPWITIKRWISNVILFVLIITITELISINPTSYITIVGWAFVLVILILPIYFTVSSLLEREVFMYAKDFFKVYVLKFKEKMFKRG